MRKNLVIKRIAVAALFFVNGFIYANWTSRLPEIQHFFKVGNALLGTILFTLAIGALIAMPLVGWLTTRFGSRFIVQLTGFFVCLMIPLIIVSPSLLVIISIFTVLGMVNGAMDVSMNGQAVYVERLWGKPIMSSFHAIFSIGMALGAGSGALFARYDIGLGLHLVLVSVFCLLVFFWASSNLVDDKPDKSLAKGTHGVKFVLPTKTILPLGIICFCSYAGEGSMADWSAIYMHKIIGKSEAMSALAFGAFGTAMTIGRLGGDYFTHRIGKRKLLMFDSLLAFIGLAVVLLLASEWTTLAGFFMVGIGLATVVPIVYSSAGNTPHVPPGVGIAMATTVGYAGFFIGPPLIGYLAQTFGLRIGLGYILFLFVVMFVMVSGLNRKVLASK